MNRHRRAALHALREVYAQVPALDCKGLCQASCGPIICSELELERASEAGGTPLVPALVVLAQNPRAVPACVLLSQDGKCSIYEHRPLICRLWGAVDADCMRCPWGCKPRSGYLTDSQSRRLLAKADEISRRYFEGD